MLEGTHAEVLIRITHSQDSGLRGRLFLSGRPASKYGTGRLCDRLIVTYENTNTSDVPHKVIGADYPPR